MIKRYDREVKFVKEEGIFPVRLEDLRDRSAKETKFPISTGTEEETGICVIVSDPISPEMQTKETVFPGEFETQEHPGVQLQLICGGPYVELKPVPS